MLTNVELFVHSILLKLLDGKIKFHFVSSILQFVENPKAESFLIIARFSRENFSLIESDLNKIMPDLESLSKSHKGYKFAVHSIISMAFSEYTYTFESEKGDIVQSNLLFLLMKKLSKNCIENLIDYLCEKEMQEVLSTPQISSSSGVFSSIIHILLAKKLDDLALKCAMHFENKSILFLNNFEGLTTIDVASENNCILTLEYLTKLKEIGEMTGLFCN